MKKFLKTITAFAAIGLLFSCEPEEDRNSLPAITLDPSEIDITVTQDPDNENLVTMTNNTPDVIPYWSYTNANGDELGRSNKQEVTVTLPFAGTYSIYFTAYTRGGGVEAVPVTVTINENNEEFFSAEEWGLLTNGVEGKTWVLDMVDPIGWGGLDFPHNPDGADFWNWYPDYAGNSWVMENKDWGEMTFDLNGGYNVSVTQTALEGSSQTTETGSFSYDIENHTIGFNGGVEMLYGGDYYQDVSDWTTLNVVELSENSMRLAVIRDQSRTGEGICKIIFHFKPKE